MKRLHFFFTIVAATALATVFIACHDDSSSSTENSDHEIEKVEDLATLECSATNEGESVYVAEVDSKFVCTSGEWMENVDLEKSSSSGISSGKINSSSSSQMPSSSSTENRSSYDYFFNPYVQYGTLTDERDGQTYRTTKIGTQLWMAENLNYFPESDSSWCYARNAGACIVYGRLYSWITAMQISKKYETTSAVSELNSPHQGVCPEGWHVPANEEWETLYGYVNAYNGDNEVGTTLESVVGWPEYYAGTLLDDSDDRFGFSVRSAGYYYKYGNMTFGSSEGKKTSFWTATESAGDANGDSLANCWLLDYHQINRTGAAFINDLSCNKYSGRSVRCIYDQPQKSSDTLKIVFKYDQLEPCTNANEGEEVFVSDKNALSYCKNGEWILSSATINDFSHFLTLTLGSFIDERDSKVYKTTKIGTQTWMAENLNYAVDNSWCYSDSAAYCTKYGRLYPWTVAMNLNSTYNSVLAVDEGVIKTPHQGVCPHGWHIPTIPDWNTLTEHVDIYGGNEGIGMSLKSTTGWSIKTWEGLNEEAGNGIDLFGFSVVSGGTLNSYGDFKYIGAAEYFWSATESSADMAYGNYFEGDSDDIFQVYDSKNAACSVRCVKDAD
jgi:uncharacterized protein (TIGR02145 family)